MSDQKKNRELGTELAVGAFVAAVFIGLAVFTIVISGKNLFRDNVFEIETVLPDAMGLRRNDPVIARGTTVGAVTDVRYRQDGVHVFAVFALQMADEIQPALHPFRILRVVFHAVQKV